MRGKEITFVKFLFIFQCVLLIVSFKFIIYKNFTFQNKNCKNYPLPIFNLKSKLINYRFRKSLRLWLHLCFDMCLYHSFYRLSIRPCSNFHRSIGKCLFRISFPRKITLRSNRHWRMSIFRSHFFSHFSKLLNTSHQFPFEVGHCLTFYRWPMILDKRHH